MSNFDNLMRLVARLRDPHDPLVNSAMDGILATIREQPELRFYVDGTVNCGHQASTVHLMRRLISLARFGGRITIVYADILEAGTLGRTPEKLALLLPGLAPDRIHDTRLAHGSCPEIRFLNYDRRSELKEQVRFGFTAGADDMNINFARELKTDYFLRLQPYLWDDGAERKAERFYQSSRIETADRYFYPVDHYPPFRAIPYKYAKADCAQVENAVWDWFTRQQTFDPNLGIRTANARAVYQASRANPDLLLWPVYGLHQFRDCRARIAANLAVCAREVQRRLVQPVVLLLLNAPSEMGDNWGLNDVELISGYDFERAEYRDVAARLTSALAHPERAVAAGIGPVPGEVYNWLYANCGLPGVFEGQNTSSLVISLGRPFLQLQRGVREAENPYPAAVGDRDMNDMAVFARAAAAQLRDADSEAGGLARTIEFMVAARDPRSQVYRYFQELGNYYQTEFHDKAFAGLAGLALLF